MYGIAFDPSSRASQYRQLVDQLRLRITNGQLPGHTRLASTRDLAEDLGVARSIILEVIDQLKREGYLETKIGSGTFVRPHLVWKEESVFVSTGGGPSRESLSFFPGMPDLELFPKRAWLSCYHRAVEYAEPTDLGYGPPQGRLDLRTALSRYLLEAKGISVGPDRIVVTAGSSQAFALLATAFPSASVAMEDPQAPFVRRIFQGLGARMAYIPVDDKGLLPAEIPGERQDFLYVTPAHQYPVGGTLEADRRVALLQRARELGAWVIEDDFDGEFRYEGRPVATLQAMAPERVVYVGSFSKTLSPGLRVGFMVLPHGLVAKVRLQKQRWDFWNEGIQQKALSLFLSEGHMERHLRRCHRAYQKKNAWLRDQLARRLGGAWTVVGATTGLHLVLRSTVGRSGVEAAIHLLRTQGLLVERVSDSCQQNHRFDDCIIIGYGNRTEEELTRLLEILESRHER